MINNGPILSRMYVPLEVFAVSAAGVLLVNFLASMIPLLAFMLITGTALPATLPLVIIPGVLVAFLAVGIGLALAPAAVLYPDVTDLLSVALLLSGFWSLSSTPSRSCPRNTGCSRSSTRSTTTWNRFADCSMEGLFIPPVRTR